MQGLRLCQVSGILMFPFLITVIKIQTRDLHSWTLLKASIMKRLTPRLLWKLKALITIKIHSKSCRTDLPSANTLKLIRCGIDKTPNALKLKIRKSTSPTSLVLLKAPSSPMSPRRAAAQEKKGSWLLVTKLKECSNLEVSLRRWKARATLVRLKIKSQTSKTANQCR